MQPTVFPALVTPSDTMAVVHCRRNITLSRCRVTFRPAEDPTGVHTFGNKALVLVDGRAQFAEVAILRLFEEAGWQGRWVETYAKPRLRPAYWREWHPTGPAAQVHAPIEAEWVNERLRCIAEANGNRFGGCWDVVAWKNERMVFAESKRAKRDALRATQLRWRDAALRTGCAENDFVVVEWQLTP